VPLPPTLLDVPTAAARLGITERHLRELIYKRRIPFVKVGGFSVRFDPDDLAAWLEASKVPTGGRGAA
jgi:excisionase family DNA binding protein